MVLTGYRSKAPMKESAEATTAEIVHDDEQTFVLKDETRYILLYRWEILIIPRPEELCFSPFSFVFVSWLNPTIRLSLQRDLELKASILLCNCLFEFMTGESCA